MSRVFPLPAIRMCVGLVLCAVCTIGFAQTATVKGRVLDASTNKPLPFCNVFLNNSTLGTTSDAEGNFEIENVPVPGVYDVIFSFVGYESVTKKVTIDGDLVLRATFLKPSSTILNSVEVSSTRDKNWEKKLKRFSKIFLGTGKHAEQCVITNPWVIDFPENDDRVFRATASGPIEMENTALGYKIKFYLIHFKVDATVYSINGGTFFQELIPENDEQAARWRDERAKAYQNSRQHLLKAIVERRIAGEGFELYSEVKSSSGTRGGFFFKEVGKSVLPLDTLNVVTDGPGKGMFTIHLENRLEIHNMAEKDNSSIYRDVLRPVSWIDSKKGSIVVNKDGFEVVSSDAITQGAMNELRVSRMVPNDYQPPSRRPSIQVTQDDLGFAQEKIYTQTDKPYYYPGETIWLKGYIRYRTPSLRDSLSTTVYAELIGPDKKVTTTRTLEVIDGSFRSEFSLPDTLVTGDYYLRCYTNLNRNFGDEQLYMKYIPVAGLFQSVSPIVEDTATFQNDLFSIETAKTGFHTREKIELKVVPMAKAGEILAGADLSISVTDMKQVSSVEVNPVITDALELGDDPKTLASSYALERGFGFRGNFKGHEGQAIKSVLNIFLLQPRYFTMTQTDDEGNFSVGGLRFYDSAYVVIVPSGKNSHSGTTTLLPRNIPSIHLPKHPGLTIHESTVAQRAPDNMKSEVTLLQEVEVRASRIQDDYAVRPYGRPDYVLSAKDIKDRNANLLQALQGRFAGLTIRQLIARDGGLRWFVYVARNAKPGVIPPEVLVVVNGNPMQGIPEEILRTISMSTVESVELTLKPGAVTGNRGANGILSVYTNLDLLQENIVREKLLIYGYSRSASFKSPDYSVNPANDRPDYRSTIYWNPDIKLDDSGRAVVEFYAADLAGKYKVVVEGVTADGTPVRAEQIITIAERN